MKGVIFNAVADAAIGLGGEELWDELLDRAGLTGAYTSLGNYDDSELLALVGVAAEMLGKTVEETAEYLGELAFPSLSANYPWLVAGHDNTVALLSTLNDVIHPEVLKLHPDASVPDFTTLRREGNELDLLYRSQRNLPSLAAGLIRGAANLFDEEAFIDVETVEDGFIFRMKFVRTDSYAPAST